MKTQGRELAKARLNDQRIDDLLRWVELDRQHQQIIERLKSQSTPGHEASQQLDTLWYEKALVADRLLSALAPQWVGDGGFIYLPLPTHVAMPKAEPADPFELPPEVCYLKARPEPERLDDGSPCQDCGTVSEGKPRQWTHNIITGHKYLCPSCEANLPDDNDPEVFAKAIRELDL